MEGSLRRIEVHSVRPARRVGSRRKYPLRSGGRDHPDVPATGMPGVRFRGGCTLLIDLATAEVRYMVRKKVDRARRALRSQLNFAADAGGRPPRQLFRRTTPPRREPFALMHHVHG